MAGRLTEIKDIANANGLTYLETCSLNLAELIGEICNAKLSDFPDNLCIIETIDTATELNKKSLNDKQWKHLVETTIGRDYGSFHRIYTDASKQKDGRVGIGVSDGRKLRSCERLSDRFQITNAELVAILKAILYFDDTEKVRIVVLTDSLNGCKWIRQGLTNNYLVHLIREQVNRMKDKQFTIQWIPSHAGISGNEEADDFANRGCHATSVSPLKITYSDAHCEIKRRMMDEWTSCYQFSALSKGRQHFKIQRNVNSKPWFHGTNLNGTEIKVLTRLRTNHGLCGLKKVMFHLEESILCDLCKVTNDLEHIVLFCEKHRDARNKFSFAGQYLNITELLKDVDTEKYRSIARFYREANLDF